MQDDKSLTSTHYLTNDWQGIRPQSKSPRLFLVNKCHKITTKWYSGKETKPSQKDSPISQLCSESEFIFSPGLCLHRFAMYLYSQVLSRFSHFWIMFSSLRVENTCTWGGLSPLETPYNPDLNKGKFLSLEIFN